MKSFTNSRRCMQHVRNARRLAVNGTPVSRWYTRAKANIIWRKCKMAPRKKAIK